MKDAMNQIDYKNRDTLVVIVDPFENINNKLE